MANKKLFLIGPGFIGGTLLVRLRDARPDITLSALTRREEQAKELRSLGVEPIMGSLHDAETIKKAVHEADIVIHTATADDVPSALAVAEGIKTRPNKDKKIVYIHTSGNDELAFSAKALTGTSTAERTLSDAKGDEVLENGRILPDAYHRQVDGPLREQVINDEAEKKHNASTTIMMPPLIYGVGVEPWKRISIQVPTLTSTMIQKGLVTLPEGFQGSWNSVWVHDLAEAYLVLLNELEAHTPGEPHPSHYCFPAEAKTFLWKDVFDAVVDELKKHGHQGNVKVIQDKATFQKFMGGKENEYSPCFAHIVFGDDNSYTRPEWVDRFVYRLSTRSLTASPPPPVFLQPSEQAWLPAQSQGSRRLYPQRGVGDVDQGGDEEEHKVRDMELQRFYQ